MSTANSEEYQRRGRAWLAEKMKAGVCPCGQSRWSFGELLYMMSLDPAILFSTSGIHTVVADERPAIPCRPAILVPVVCENCGFVMLFDPDIMGLFPKTDVVNESPTLM